MIIGLINELKPQSVNQIVDHISEKYELPRKDILKAFLSLENSGSIKLIEPPVVIPENVIDYIFTNNAAWFWGIIGTSIITGISVFSFQNVPLSYLRQFFGFIFILILPGFSFVKALFPEKSMNRVEKTTLSIGLSITLTPLVGMLLNYTPWGLTILSVTLSLLGLTILLSITGVIREHNYLRKNGVL